MILKILQIIPDLNKGGAERLTLNICNELTKITEVQVKLVTFRPDNLYPDLTKEIDWQVIPAYYKPSLSSQSISETNELRAFIEAYQPDIIHSHLFESEMVSRNVLYDKAVYFTHCHDNMKQFENLHLSTFLNKQLATNYMEKQLLLKQYAKTKKNYFITVSKHSESFFRSVLPRHLNKNIIKMANAIDFSYFNEACVPGRTDRNYCRFRWLDG